MKKEFKLIKSYEPLIKEMPNMIIISGKTPQNPGLYQDLQGFLRGIIGRS
jgi:hypothetical protein